METLEVKATTWVKANAISAKIPDSEYYCETRDRFDVRLAAMAIVLVDKNIIGEAIAYFIKSIAGEIGNNSFDHNVGNWPDVPGVFFGYDFSGIKKQIILADRGRGILTTLKKVKPELAQDDEAMRIAFTERLSARLPERRGNGLKFVRESIASLHLHLDFFSGNAKAELNEKMEITEVSKSIHGCLAILSFSDNLNS